MTRADNGSRSLWNALPAKVAAGVAIGLLVYAAHGIWSMSNQVAVVGEKISQLNARFDRFETSVTERIEKQDDRILAAERNSGGRR